MRNVFLFIRRFFNLILFVLLMIFSITTLIRYNQSYEAVFSNTANELTGRIGGQYNSVEYYFKLKKTNEALANENAELRNLLKASFDNPDTTTGLYIDSLLKDTLGYIRKYKYLPAKVVNNDVSSQNNYITLYRGSKQGAQTGMGVIGPEGIVGRVVLVSDNYCRVMSVLNRNSKVSAMLKKGLFTGLLSWDGKNPQYLTMINIPKSSKVKIGDSVLTSNLSGSFPPGIMVGRVAKISTDPSTQFLNLAIKSSTDFYSVQYGYLVNNLIYTEQKALEDKTPKTP